jgi:hypothetical protein
MRCLAWIVFLRELLATNVIATAVLDLSRAPFRATAQISRTDLYQSRAATH